MRYIHRTSFYMTPEQRHQIEELGFKVPPGTLLGPGVPLVAFDAAEDHPNWPALCSLFMRWNVAPHSERTEFTPRELDEARWLELRAWNNGFPQPQVLEDYVRVTYDLTHWCSKCGYGKIQNAPFRIKCEPKWNRRSIMTLIWVHDEFFVPPAIWETVFKPFGIGCRPVANRRGIELKTVVQLVVDEEVDIVTEGLKPLPCEACGLVRYEWPTRGPFPALLREPASAIAKSRQRLGHGWSNHAVFISQDLFQAFKAHNLRGAEVTPVDAALPAAVA